MSDIEIIEEIKRLPREKRERVIEFIRSLDVDDWDRDIAADARAGRLDPCCSADDSKIRRRFNKARIAVPSWEKNRAPLAMAFIASDSVINLCRSVP